jgi:peptidoglycan L-alanyl-D-glutamate endopeptidase CwlK
MFKLSRRSYDRLTGVDQRLIFLCEKAIKVCPVDFGTAFEGGRRTADNQNQLFKNGHSTKDGYSELSKHQTGQAFDFIPFLNGTPDLSEHYYFMVISCLFTCAKELEITIRSGANWNQDDEWKTGQKFLDLGHIELMI